MNLMSTKLSTLGIDREGAWALVQADFTEYRGTSRDVPEITSLMIEAGGGWKSSIKRVWVRYRNKLKGLPLELVRWPWLTSGIFLTFFLASYLAYLLTRG